MRRKNFFQCSRLTFNMSEVVKDVIFQIFGPSQRYCDHDFIVGKACWSIIGPHLIKHGNPYYGFSLQQNHHLTLFQLKIQTLSSLFTAMFDYHVDLHHENWFNNFFLCNCGRSTLAVMSITWYLWDGNTFHIEFQ